MNYDVFISYAHNDNYSLRAEDRWVVKFHEALFFWLRDFMKRPPNIFYDEVEMTGNNILTPKIETALTNSKVLIPIVSSYYLQSEWCKRELEFFKKQYDSDAQSRSRLFPIIKTPLATNEEESLKTLLNDNLYGKFYSYDITGKILQKFDPIFGGDHEQKFFLLINDLARQIAEFIKEIEIEPPDDDVVVIEPTVNLPLVYLAEPSPDLIEQYNEIRRDLEQRKDLEKLKFDFLTPEPKKIAEDENAYKQKVIQDLRKCSLVINLVGKEPNSFPKGGTKSHIQIQMEAAAEVEDTFNFTRLVWIPRNVTSEDADLQSFIENIRQTGVGMDGLMQDSLENFKSRIIKVLTEEEESPNPEEKPWVYVLYDKSDLDSAILIEEELSNKGYPIFSTRDYLDPALSGSEIDVLKEHNDYLTRCDAVLIYWDKSPLTWVRKSIFDLPRIKPVRKQSFRAQAVFCTGDIKAKSVFRTPPPPNLMKVEDYPNLSKFLDKLSKEQNDERE